MFLYDNSQQCINYALTMATTGDDATAATTVLMTSDDATTMQEQRRRVTEQQQCNDSEDDKRRCNDNRMAMPTMPLSWGPQSNLILVSVIMGTHT